jgi:DnaJ-class molecular chaperone
MDQSQAPAQPVEEQEAAPAADAPVEQAPVQEAAPAADSAPGKDPKKADCPDCSGTGLAGGFSIDNDKVCPTCDGSGQVAPAKA